MEFVSTKLVLIGVRVHLFPSRTQKFKLTFADNTLRATAREDR